MSVNNLSKVTQNELRNSHHDAMIRWQGYARESRTAVNNHFLVYSAGILAFQTTIIISGKPVLIPSYFIIAGVFAILAFTMGSVVVILRLEDARATARVARLKFINNLPQVIKIRKRAARLSGAINFLLPFQVGFFILSACTFMYWLYVAYLTKIVI